MKSTLNLIVAGAIGGAALLLATGQAGAISYTLDAASGLVRLTGTIVTDDHLGVLSRSDIVDWNLVLRNAISTANLTGPLSGNNSTLDPNIGTDLTAAANALIFNFGSTSNAGFPEFSNNTGTFACLNNLDFICPAGNGHVSSISLFSGSDFIPEVGPTQIGSVAAPVPGPIAGAGLPGLILACGALLVLARRRRQLVA